MELTPEQKKRAKRLSNLIAKGNLAILEYLDEVEEKIENSKEEVKEMIAKDTLTLTEILPRIKGDKGDTPTDEELIELITPLIPEPKSGVDYVLTDEDKVEIATIALMDVEFPTVEKIIEKTEVIRETPIVTENVVEKAVPENAQQIRDKIESLVGEERLDKTAIKGLEVLDTVITKTDLDRGLSIVDSRTSYLLNKINNLPTGGSSFDVSQGDARYLQLTTANGPLTGDLYVTKTNAAVRVSDNTSSVNFAELYANSTNVGFLLSLIDGESVGGISFDGLSFTFTTNFADGYTFSGGAFSYISGTSSSTQQPFYLIGDNAVSGTNINGGEIRIVPGKSKGSGTSSTVLYASGGGASGTAFSDPFAVATFGYNTATFASGYTITTTGPINSSTINTGNGAVEVYPSGTYTPTLTNTTNVSASTARLCTYYRVGNAVTVAGQLDIDPTAAGAVVLGISLPIASNFSTAFQLGGTASSITIANESAGIQADATNDRASLQYVAVDTTNHTMTFTFTYQVI